MHTANPSQEERSHAYLIEFNVLEELGINHFKLYISKFYDSLKDGRIVFRIRVYV